METLKDKVAVVGVGCIKTGEHWNKSVEDMLVEACYEAFADAGLEPRDIQAAWMGSNYQSGIGGTLLNHYLKFEYIPVSRSVNACATSGDAFRNACAFLAAGLYDIVMVCGVEKLKDSFSTGLAGGGDVATAIGHDTPFFHNAPPHMFALFATRYAHHYGYSLDEVRRALARIAVKNHRHGARNPKAFFQNEITLEQALNAPPIAYPLGLYDCCASVDGAAALILARPEVAQRLRSDYALVKGIGMSCGNRQGMLQSSYDFVHFPENTIAAQTAYDMAGVKDPFKEIDMAEFHDAFTSVELLAMEDVGLAPRGKAPEYLFAGVYDLEGELPTNTDGGLKCSGHPVSATGLKMIYEVTKQLQGKAAARQVKNVRLALTHNQGGHPGVYNTVIGIFGARD